MLRGIPFFSQHTVFQPITIIDCGPSNWREHKATEAQSRIALLTWRPRRFQTLHKSYWLVCIRTETGELVKCNTPLQPAFLHLLSCHVKLFYAVLAGEWSFTSRSSNINTGVTSSWEYPCFWRDNVFGLAGIGGLLGWKWRHSEPYCNHKI